MLTVVGMIGLTVARSALSGSCGICYGDDSILTRKPCKKQNKAKRWGEIRCQKMKGWGSLKK